MTSPNGLPQALPPSVVNGLVARILTPAPTGGVAQPPPAGPAPTPGTTPGGPVGGSPTPPGAPAGGPAPPTLPGPAPDTPQQPGGPDGPAPGPGPQPSDGLGNDQAEALQALLADPKIRAQVLDLAKRADGSDQGPPKPQLDPQQRLDLAQGWNSYVGSLALQMNAARSPNPGASKASDEALLRIYWMTPLAPWAPDDKPEPIPLSDIDEYADAVRVQLVKGGWTDIDKIEDQVTRECFPLRETLIKSGRDWQQQIDFVDGMLKLTDRWHKRYGELPQPDLKVLAATRAGRGDPESQARDTDSSPYPPGGLPNPPLGEPSPS